MNKEDAIKELKKIQECGDIEIAHSMADNIICSFLLSLGYFEIVTEYNKIDKWYA